MFLNIHRYSFICVLLVLLTGCEEKSAYRDVNSNLAHSHGKVGEILMLLEDNDWDDTLGKSLRTVLSEPMPGLLHDEAQFSPFHVPTSHFNGFLHTHHSILIPYTLDQSASLGHELKRIFPEEWIDKLAQKPVSFLVHHQDVFANHQEVIFLVAKDKKELLKLIHNNKNQIQRFFHRFSVRRIEDKIFDSNELRKTENEIEKKYHFRIRIPNGYTVAMEKPDFLWLRNYSQMFDMNIFIKHVPYTSKDQLTHANILKMRDEICKTHIFENDKKDSYVITSFDREPYFQKTSINNLSATETRGIWKIKDNAMGGTFLSYTFTDGKELYYIEGFLYNPGHDKLDYMRRIEAILRTFDIRK